jgi:hypothetical protein
MVYNDVSTSLGLIQEVNALCDSDNTSYPVADKTRRLNSAYEQVIGWIITADGTWQFDDSNFTTNPVGTIDLVAGQSQYSFNTAFLDIVNVKVKDNGGNWHILHPIDQTQLDYPLEDWLIANGQPQMYDKQADGIRLYPAPDNGSTVTLTAGLKIEFQRTASLFTAADTTKAPGFASPYHVILAYMASLPYCMSYKKDRITLYEKKVMDMKQEIIIFYSQREKDKRKVITSAPISFR